MKLFTNTANTVYVTASELQTLSNPYYLFEFTADMTNNVVRCLSTNISSATSRYDMFRITLTGSSYVNVSASTISLDLGWHNYKIYEQTTATNFQVSGTTSLLEQGKCLVTGSTSVINYITPPASFNTITYITPNI